MDWTIYPAKDRTPDQIVRDIFGLYKASAIVCLLFSQHRLLSYERISMLGRSEDQVRISFSKVIGYEDRLGSDDSELACRNLMTARSPQQATMLVDLPIVLSGQDAQIDIF